MRRMFTADEVRDLANDIWGNPNSHPAIIEVGRGGYDLGQDFEWAMSLRVSTLGRDLTCYLSALDLASRPEDLRAILVEGWREFFWNEKCLTINRGTQVLLKSPSGPAPVARYV